MQIARNTVVTIRYELSDIDGNLIERSEDPVDYLHGGYDGIFPPVELALEGKATGDSCKVRLEPEDAFGEYDAELVRVEPRSAFPKNVSVGMRFEGQGESEDETLIYTVTDISDDKVVVDGNHPLAGRALDFSVTVDAVRAATGEEIEHGHAHGAHGHHH